MWAVIVIGAFIGLSASFFFKVEDARLHAIEVLLLAVFIGLVIFMIVALDRPFRGDLGIQGRSVSVGLRPTDETMTAVRLFRDVVSKLFTAWLKPTLVAFTSFVALVWARRMEDRFLDLFSQSPQFFRINSRIIDWSFFESIGFLKKALHPAAIARW